MYKLFIVILLFAVFSEYLFAQAATQKIKAENENKVAGSSGQVSNSVNIPNWKNNEHSSGMLIEKDNKGKISSVISHTSGGSSLNSLNKKSFFEENKNKLGFPIGWASNSKKPILNSKENSSIGLKISGTNTYITKLVTIKELCTYKFLIIYSSSRNAKLQLTQFDNQNNIINIEYENLYSNANANGKYEFATKSGVDKIMIKITNISEGYFVLENFVIVEVEI